MKNGATQRFRSGSYSGAVGSRFPSASSLRRNSSGLSNSGSSNALRSAEPSMFVIDAIVPPLMPPWRDGTRARCGSSCRARGNVRRADASRGRRVPNRSRRTARSSRRCRSRRFVPIDHPAYPRRLAGDVDVVDTAYARNCARAARHSARTDPPLSGSRGFSRPSGRLPRRSPRLRAASRVPLQSSRTRFKRFSLRPAIAQRSRPPTWSSKYSAACVPVNPVAP